MALLPLDRLLAGPPWVRYRALIDLAGVPRDSGEAAEARAALLGSPQVRVLLKDVAAWPGTVLNNHRSASQTFHTLSFLAELGAGADRPEVSTAVGRILERMRDDGIPRLPMTYPEHFGGPGVEVWGWALCDAPVILRALVRFGLGADPRVRKGVKALAGLAEPFGWPCRVCPELGSFRGPGKKTDPCPYATLSMLDLIAAAREEAPGDRGASELADGPEAAAGVEALLACWDKSGERHPYMFFMGTDFRKLKAPGLWYDILHVADVLSRFPAALSDPRLRSMLDLILSKATPDGEFTPESVYQPYKAWDFGQKKEASPWLALRVARIAGRSLTNS